MNRKSKLFLLFCFLSAVIIIIIASIATGGRWWINVNQSFNNSQNMLKGVLGEVSHRQVTPTTELFPTPTAHPTPTVIPYSIELKYAPEEITEGEIATFSWEVSGPENMINSSTIYFGRQSDAEPMSKSEGPEVTKYSDSLIDFMDGEYVIPLRFTANKKIRSPGRYFFRAYAIIDAKHYWTEERSLEVKKVPINEVKIINYLSEVLRGENFAFTWDITGPGATTGYTAILYGKESKPGTLDTTVTVSMTPYTALVKDYTEGSYNIPLRFVGNAAISEPGEYYFRALAIIKEKNIWSDEKSFTVR